MTWDEGVVGAVSAVVAVAGDMGGRRGGLTTPEGLSGAAGCTSVDTMVGIIGVIDF